MSERKLFGANEKKRGLTIAFLLDIMAQTGKKQFSDNKAIVIRPSRTEPLFRLFAEAKKQEKALSLSRITLCCFKSIFKSIAD